MAGNLNSSRSYLDTGVFTRPILSSPFFLPLLCNNQKDIKKMQYMQKKILGPARTPGTPGTIGPRSRGPGRTGPRDLEGPVVLPGQDLETLKVLGT